MKQKLSHLAEACTDSLADDIALRLEVRQELQDHLDDALAEELSTGSEPATAAQAVEARFGAPEEISRQLLLSNWRRLQSRARWRWLCKVLLLPALLGCLILGVDWRLFGSLTMLMCNGLLFSPVAESPKSAVPSWLFKISSRRQTRQLPADEQLLVSRYLHKLQNKPHLESSLAWSRQLHQESPGDRMYCAIYALNLARELGNRLGNEEAQSAPTIAELSASFTSVLAIGRAIDQQNALYDYLEAFVIAAPAVRRAPDAIGNQPGNRRRGHPTYEIHDRQAFAQAMELFRGGLGKPLFRTYTMDITHKTLAIMAPGDDFSGRLQRLMLAAATETPHLTILRQLTGKAVFYGEILCQEGNAEAGQAQLACWRQYLPQIAEFHGVTMTELYCLQILAEYFQTAATHLGNSDEAANLAKASNFLRDRFSSTDSNEANLRDIGGTFIMIFSPALRIPISNSELAAERQLDYAILDLISLSIFNAFLLVIILLFAIALVVSYLCGKRPFIIFLPAAAYRQIFGFGLILPLAIFLIYIHVPFLSGRDFSLLRNIGQVLPGYLLLAPILLFAYSLLYQYHLERKKRTLGFAKKRLPYATIFLNTFIMLTLLLVSVNALLQPTMKWKCRQQLAKSQLTKPGKHFFIMEERVINELHGQFQASLPPTSRAFAPLDETHEPH